MRCTIPLSFALLALVFLTASDAAFTPGIDHRQHISSRNHSHNPHYSPSHPSPSTPPTSTGTPPIQTTPAHTDDNSRSAGKKHLNQRTLFTSPAQYSTAPTVPTIPRVSRPVVPPALLTPIVTDPATLSVCSPTQPSSGGNLTIDFYSTVYIEWISYNLFYTTSMKIELYQNNSFISLIVQGISNTGSYTWIPANGLTASLPNNPNFVPSLPFFFRVSSQQENILADSVRFNFTMLGNTRTPYSSLPAVSKTGSFPNPFNTYWQGEKWQSIYLASESGITSSPVVRLNSIGFRIAQQPGTSMPQFRIAIGFTSSSSFLVDSATKFFSPTVVYGPTLELSSSFTVNSYRTFQVGTVTADLNPDTQIVWPPGKNLVVEVSYFNVSGWKSGGGCYHWDTGASIVLGGTARSMRYYADTTFISYPWSMTSPLSDTTLAFLNILPHMQWGVSTFVGTKGCGYVTFQTPPSAYVWSPLVASASAVTDCSDPTLPYCRTRGSLVSYSSTADGDHFNLVLFGGAVRLFTDSASNDLWIFNSMRGKWIQLQTSDCSATDRPACRIDHGAVVVRNSSMFVWGGRDTDYNPIDSIMWRLDLTQLPNKANWTKIVPTQTVRPGAGFTMVTDGNNRIWVFGGMAVRTWGSQQTLWYTNQLLQYNISTNRWGLLFDAGTVAIIPNQASVNNSLSNGYCSDFNIYQPIPVPCTCWNSGVYDGNDFIYIFGGVEMLNIATNDITLYDIRYTNSLHRYSISTNTWYALNYRDCGSTGLPSCRGFHSSALRSPGTLVLTTGFYFPFNSQPSVVNDLWELDLSALPSSNANTSTQSWSRIIQNDCANGASSSPTLPRCVQGAMMVQANQSMILFGGENLQPGVSQYTNSLWVYRAPPMITAPNSSLPTRTTNGTTTVTIAGSFFGNRASDIDVRILGPYAAPYASSVPCSSLSLTPGTWADALTDRTGWNKYGIVCSVPPGVGANVTFRVGVMSVHNMTSVGVGLFSYLPPFISSLNRNGTGAPTSGGVIILSGSNFGPSGFQDVAVGDSSCASLVWVSHQLLNCFVREGTGANLFVTVKAGGQVSNALSYSYDPPIIANVSVVNSNTTGTTVTVIGANFGPDKIDVPATLTIGRTVLTDCVVSNHASLVCTVPPGVGANYSITVTTGGQVSVPFAKNFSYLPPSITYFEGPPTPPSGNTYITIHGANFGPATAGAIAYIGNTPCINTQYIDPHTTLLCLTPPIGSLGATGLVVSVTVGNQTTQNTTNTVFSYTNPIVLGSSYPGAGNTPTTGGVTLTITGFQLGTPDYPPTVQIGPYPCAPVMWNSSSLITCPVPPGIGSNLPVRTLLGGQISVSPTTFSYDAPSVLNWNTGLFRSPSGGYPITIIGNNFGPVSELANTNVSIGSLPCSGLTMNIPHSSLVCTVPESVGSNLPILINVGSQSVQFTTTLFSYDPPTIINVVIEGNSSTTGGDLLNITGINFLPELQPYFSFNITLHSSVPTVVGTLLPCTFILWKNPSLLQCGVPEGVGKTWTLVVEQYDSRRPNFLSYGSNSISSSSIAAGYAYHAPEISAVKYILDSSSTGAGSVEIQGSNFGPASAAAIVTVGGERCESQQWVSHSQINCVIKAGAGAGKSVALSVAGQSVAYESTVVIQDPNGRIIGSSIGFSYLPPAVSEVYPNAISLGTRARITISGAFFGNNQSLVSVRLGDTACEKPTLSALYEVIECETPSFSSAVALYLSVVVGGQESNKIPVTFEATVVPMGLRAAMVFLATFINVTAFCLLIIVGIMRKTPDIRAASPPFLALFLLGTIAVESTVYTLDDTTGLCQLSIFILILGFTVAYGSLLLKNYRILKVFNNKTLTTFVMSDKQLLMNLGLFLVVDVILLAPFIALTSCLNSLSGIALALVVLMALYKVGMIAAGVVIAYKSRVINMDRFQERQQLGYAIYNVSFSIIILFPVSALFSAQTVAVYAIRCIGISFIVGVTIGVIFIPKFFSVCETKRKSNEAARERSVQLQQYSNNRVSEEDLTNAGDGNISHISTSRAPKGEPTINRSVTDDQPGILRNASTNGAGISSTTLHLHEETNTTLYAPTPTPGRVDSDRTFLSYPSMPRATSTDHLLSPSPSPSALPRSSSKNTLS